MLIPLLDVLFSRIDENVVVPAIPEFNLSVDYAKNVFNHYVYRYAKQDKLHALYFISAVILVSVFFANLFRFLSQSVLTKMRTNVVYKLRKAVYDKLSNLHLGYFTHQRKGNLMSVISNDISEIENSVVSSIQVVFREPLMIFVYFIFLFFISFKLTLFTLVFLPVSGLLITYLSKKLRKKANQGQQLLGNIMSITEELISGIRIIKAFNAQDFIRNKFNKENEDYRKITKSIVNKRELASPVSEFLGVTVVLGVIIYGGKLVLEDTGELNASMFITYLAFYSQILSPAKNISSAITNIQRGLAAGDRVLNIIDIEEEIAESASAKSISGFNDKIEYKNVSFAYTKGDEGHVLKNINLTIAKGKTIALVGQSGSGKTTMADMLPRFYDPSQGNISIDGVDIKDCKIADLRALMGIVTQDSILFNDTVFNNIAFGMDNVSENDVIEAAKIANAHEFIIQMPGGYQNNIGDRGNKLSGGQRQRLSIARAILKNPPILILDEATSALDTESEKLVQDALNKLMKNRTSLIIAHRLSTIQHADEIIVLKKGEIIERGSHNDLISTLGTYKKLYDLQLFV